MLLFDGQDLEHIIDLKTKTLDDTFRLDRLLLCNSVLCELSRKQILQLETFTEVRPHEGGASEREYVLGWQTLGVVDTVFGLLAEVQMRKVWQVETNVVRCWHRSLTYPATTRVSMSQVKHFVPGEMVWQAGEPVERVVFVAKGKLAFVNIGKYLLEVSFLLYAEVVLDGLKTATYC